MKKVFLSPAGAPRCKTLHAALRIALSAAFFALFFTSCFIVNFAGNDAVTGRGNPETFEFRVGSFSSIRVEGYCEIQYFSSPSNIVTLEVQPNLREYFFVEVVNDELVVRTTRRINVNSNRIPILTISAPTLNNVSFSGAGSFIANDKIIADSLSLRMSGAAKIMADLDVSDLNIDMSGAGSFELSGSADAVHIFMSGAGGIEALQLRTREARIILSGAGSVNISCSEKLTINASGMGSILYRGTPDIDLSRGGMVNIRRVAD